MMAIGYESPDENFDDEQYGGRLSAQNAYVMDRLYDPKQSQSQFTGRALLDTGTKRLRPMQAMDYWATKKVEQKLRQPEIQIVETEAQPQPTDTTTKPAALEGALSLIRERGLVGAKNFWRLLADSNAKQKESLEAARRYNREHKDDIAAKTKQTKKSWITWREATDYYLENGGTEKVATVAERQQKLDPEKRKALEKTKLRPRWRG
jgi:hypothetical protein